jgi:uncharacterized repeat protein (TIGR01451 family)
MKLLRVIIPAVAASALLFILFAWAHQSALANATQPGERLAPGPWPASNSNAPQASAVITRVLPSGDNYIHGLIYYNGYLYGSTRSYPNPARVLKIDPNTLDVVVTQTLSSGFYDGEDIIAAGGYLWVILYTKPARLVRLDPNSDTLDWETAVTFSDTVTSTMDAGESLDYAFGSLWAGGRDHLARVDITTNPLTPTYLLYDLAPTLNLTTSNAGLLGSLAHDAQFLWGTYKQYAGDPDAGTFYASTVVKMKPVDPTGVYAKTEISTDTPDDSAFTGGAYFVGGEGLSSHIYKFSSNPAVYTVTRVSDSPSYGLFVNPGEPQFVWGAYVGSPGIVKKFDLNASPLLTVTLPAGFNDPSEIAFDGDGNVYVTTWQDPAGIVKLPAQYLTSDLRIGMGDFPDPVYAGGRITYTLTITNAGPMDASAVLVTDTLPVQVNFVSSSPSSANCTHSSGLVTCHLGQLKALTSQQVTIVANVSASASGTINNTASVTSSLTDPDPQNNTAQGTTMVTSPPPPSADLLVGIAATPNPVAAGQRITYTLAITNSGPSNATGVVLSNTLPLQVSFVSSSPSSPNCTHSNSLVTCNFTQLNASSSQKVTVVAAVDELASGTLTDYAQVTASTPDPNPQNNSASRQTAVINSADLRVQISADKTRVAFGDLLSYTVRVDNLGPTSALSVAVQDLLPDGVDFISSSPGSFPCANLNGTVTCAAGKLGANENVILQLLVRLNRAAVDPLHNVVSVSSITPDPVTGNNTASSDTQVYHRLFLPVTR